MSCQTVMSVYPASTTAKSTSAVSSAVAQPAQASLRPHHQRPSGERPSARPWFPDTPCSKVRPTPCFTNALLTRGLTTTHSVPLPDCLFVPVAPKHSLIVASATLSL